MKNSQQTLNIIFSHRTRGQDVEGVHIRGICNALRQDGHKVDVVSVPGVDVYKLEGVSEKTNSKFFPWSSVSKYIPQILFEILEIGYNLILYWNLKQVIKGKHIDFIYERYALNTFATALIGKKYGIPVIEEINDATGIRRVRKHRIEFLAKWIETWVFEKSAALITISSEFERILIGRGFPREKVSFVPNAVDPDVFNTALYDHKIRTKLKLENKLVVGFVGSFALWHGVDLVLQIAPELIRKIPNIHFLMVGSGLKLNDVKNKVSQMGFSNEFTFTGRVDYRDVPQYLNVMDIGLIPDSNEYGSPMKLFEYMSMGVVPVVPRLPPIEDVIDHGITGLMFTPGNTSDMVDQITKIYVDSALKKMLSENARAQVAKNHYWHHNAEHLLQVFHDISRKGA